MMTPEEQEQLDLDRAQRDQRAKDAAPDRIVITAAKPTQPPVVAAPVPNPTQDGAARAALAVTSADKPDMETTINRLSIVTGRRPSELRALGADEINRLAREQRVMLGTQDAPKLRSRFTDPDFARVASDDVPSLAEIEKQMAEAQKAYEAARRAPKAAAPKQQPNVRWEIDQNGNVVEVLDSSEYVQSNYARGGASGVDPLRSTLAAVPDIAAIVPKGLEWLSDTAGELLRAPDSVVLAAQFGATDAEINAMPTGSKPKNPDALLERISSWSNSAANALNDLGDTIAPEATGNWAVDTSNELVRGAVRSIGITLAAVLSGNPQAAMPAMMGSTAAESYHDFKEQGVPYINATLGAVTQGGIEGATEILPFNEVLGSFASKTPFARAVWDFFKAEVPGEIVAYVSQDIVDWATVDPSQPFEERMAAWPEGVVKTFLGAILTAGTQTGIFSAVNSAEKGRFDEEQRLLRQKAMSEGGLAALNAMAASAAESKTLERDPDQFEKYVDSLAQDAPINAVYIKAEALAAIAASEAKSADELATELGVGEQKAEALMAGSAMRVELGRFLRVISGKESTREAYLRSVSTSPFTLSQDELKTELPAQLKALALEAEKLVGKAMADDAFAQEVDGIRQAIEKDLTTAGRFVGTPNQLYAQITATAYGVLAKRLGTTPAQLFADNPLRVGGERLTSDTDAMVGQDEKTIEVVHFSKASDLARTDPAKYGANYRIIPPEEQQNQGVAPNRTYFGMDEGQAGGYRKEQGLGDNKYYAYLNPDKLYDMAADPLGLRAQTDAIVAEYRDRGRMITHGGAMEMLVERAGYRGFWMQNPRIGRVAAVFDPVDVYKERRAQKPKEPAAILNIGLKIGEDGVLDPADARAAVEATGAKIVSESIHESNTEQTLVAVLDRALTQQELYAVSEATQQDAIAQRTGRGQGMLAGPKAEAWGDYNPEYFLMPDGQTAAAQEGSLAQEELRGPRGAEITRQADGFAILDADPNTRTSELKDQLGVSPRQASVIRKAWKEARGIPTNKSKPGRSGVTPDYYAQTEFAPMSESAADDLLAADPAEWASIVKATKYAAYRIPDGQEDQPLPKGYALVWHTSGAYAVSEKHIAEREKAGAATFTRVAQETGKEKRGLYTPSKNTINLLSRADFSTFLHEMGHHWLEVLARVGGQLRQRERAGETLTPGEQELVNDIRTWLREQGNVRRSDTPAGGPNTGSYPQERDPWMLKFYDNLLIDATEDGLKTLRVQVAMRGMTPALRLFRTTNGRIIAFPHDYTHADARMLLEHMNKPGGKFKMAHATWDPATPLKRQNWYDTTGELDDDGGSFAQLMPASAATAPTAKLDEARAMEADGADAKAIWQQTGWARTKGGDWVWELPGLPAFKFNPEKTAQIGRLDQLIDWPELFDAMPMMRDVYLQASTGQQSGKFYDAIALDMPDGTTKIAPLIVARGRIANTDELMRTIRHEIQHAIQVYGGFASTGASATDIEAYRGTEIFEKAKAAYRKMELDFLKANGQEATEENMSPEATVEAAAALTVYVNNHGEFQARDVEWRSFMSAEWRAANPPGTPVPGTVETVEEGKTWLTLEEIQATRRAPVAPAESRPAIRIVDSIAQSAAARETPRRQAVQASDRDIDRASKEMSDRDFQVYKGLVAGLTNQQIIAQLNDEIENDADFITTAQMSVIVKRVRLAAEAMGITVPQKDRNGASGGLSPQTLHIIALSAKDYGPKQIAEIVYGTSDKAGQVRVLRNRHSSLIAKMKAEREGSYGQSPVFYSALERAVQNAKQAKAPAADWKAILRKVEGVKADEIEAVGLFDWLDLQAADGGQVTREAVLEFVKSNGVRVDEVLLGPPPEKPTAISEDLENNQNNIDIETYNDYVSLWDDEINDEFNTLIAQQFDENFEVFIEENPAAQRLYDAAADNVEPAIREQLYEEYYNSGYFEPQFYVEEEEDASYEGEDDPPMVWVIKLQGNRRAKQDEYGGPYATEEEAQEAADEMNNEDERDAADLYVSESDDLVTRTREAVFEDSDFMGELRELYDNSLDADETRRARLEATRSVFVSHGESQLFDAVHPGFEYAGGTSTGRPTFPPTKWDRYTLVRGAPYRELILTLASHKGQPYTHTVHWPGINNPFGHVRFSIIDDVVVIDEAQNDWHQQGRDKGYKDPAKLKAAIYKRDAALDAYDDLLRELARELNAKTPKDGDELYDNYATSYDTMRAFHDMLIAMSSMELSEAVRSKYEAAADKLARAKELRTEYLGAREAANQASNGIPDAPMKDAKAWGSLLMKRMIRWAAENGHRGIAWTPGDVHAERWNMFNVVDTLYLVPQQDGNYGLVGYKNDRNVFTKADLTNSQIVEYVGKDVAKALLATEAKAQDGYPNAHKLPIGDDIMVGPGKGMRFFYDTALVDLTNKILKKYGGKVGEKVYEHPGKQRKPGAGGARDRVPPGTGPIYAREATAYHYFDIPQALADDAMAGLPLFQPQQDGTPPGVPPAQRVAQDLGPDADELDIFNAMSLAQKTPIHELWARQTEVYFFEGKAPTPALRGMFRRFASWIKDAYKTIIAANPGKSFGEVMQAPLTDEVRQIMDRIYASAEDIAEAHKVNGMGLLFDTKPEGMSDDEWQAYQALGAEAQDEAEETLRTRSLRDMKWLANAKARELARLQREAKDQRRAMRAEVAAEVLAEPVNVARAFLTRGKDKDGNDVPSVVPAFMNGELTSGSPKLNIDALKVMYPEGSGVQWQNLKYGQYGMLAANGLHPDALAPMFGYASGDAMVRDLLTAENANDKIEGETDRRMLERYGDLSSEQDVARAADEAVHSGMRARVLAAEYAALTAAIGQRKLLNEAAIDAAAKMVDRMRVSKLSAAKFQAAERKAGKAAEAAMRKGDLAGAALAKRDQILSFHLAREVAKQQKEYDKAILQFRKIVTAKKDTVAKSRNFDLVQASRAVLASVGFAQMRNKPLEYLSVLKAYDPQLYASLEPQILTAMTGAKIADMTVQQFTAMRDVVVQLWQLSRQEKLVEINGQSMDLKDVTDEINTLLVQRGADPNRTIEKAATAWERFMRMGEGAFGAMRRVESWARFMDGNVVGPFTKYLWRPISQAATRYRTDQLKYIAEFRALFKPIEKTLTDDAIAAPELGYTFNGKAELLHAILHTGNDSNQRKLLLGRKWATEDQDGNVDTSRWDAFVTRMIQEGRLTATDYQFAQGVWDLLERIKPLAQAAHRKVFGAYFSEVTARPVQTPFGAFRGGYVPAVYDDFHSTAASMKAEQELLTGNEGSMFPSPAKGFTEARVKYEDVMQLDLRLMSSHIDKVLKFAHMAPPVRDVLRILNNKSVERHLADVHASAKQDILIPWLVRSARQQTEFPMSGNAGRLVSIVANGLRRRSSMGLMFGNLLNVLQQPTGLLNAVAFKGVKKRHVAVAMARFLRDPIAMHRAVRAASPLIEQRSTDQAIAIRDAVNSIVEAKGAYQKAADWFERHTYFAQVALQNQQDVVVWSGAYYSAIDRGETEAEARMFADAVIRQTQGSAVPEDVSRLETGTGWNKVFIAMYGYFNMWGNQLSTEFRTTVRDVGLKKGAGRLLYVYVAGFMLPALLAQAIADGMRGDLPDDDEDEPLAAWLAWFFGTQAKTAAAMGPGIGTLAVAGLNALNDKPYDDRVLSSPAISALESGVKTPLEIYKLFTGEGDFSRTTKSTLGLMTLLTGLPFQALSRPVGYAVDVMEGDTQPEDALDAARGAIAGR